MRCCICNLSLVRTDELDCVVHTCPDKCHIITKHSSGTYTEEFPIWITVGLGSTSRVWDGPNLSFKEITVPESLRIEVKNVTEITTLRGITTRRQYAVCMLEDWELHRYEHLLAPGTVQLPEN